MTGGTKGRRGGRKLSPEERKLWDRVAATTVRIEGDRAPGDEDATSRPALPALPAEPETPKVTLRPIPEGREPRVTITRANGHVGPVGHAEAGLDRRTAGRLRKGAREPDARIDLHGMTAERAHRACLRFLGDSLARGHRVVLVITGKGRRDTEEGFSGGRGVIRDSLPGWLRASPLGHAVIGIYEAHRKHGGAGAFYVYLKRQR